MVWSSDAVYRATGKAPDCFDCQHYHFRETRGEGEHCCSMTKAGFPNVGRYCPAYVYEPGSDKAEAEE